MPPNGHDQKIIHRGRDGLVLDVDEVRRIRIMVGFFVVFFRFRSYSK